MTDLPPLVVWGLTGFFKKANEIEAGHADQVAGQADLEGSPQS